MTRIAVRRIALRLHLWVGLLAGLYIVVVCATGAALVFRIDMQRALHPHLFTPSGTGPQADPAAIIDSVSRAYPDDRLSGIDAPTTARPTYLAYVMRGDQFLTVLVDPISAQVLGELPDRSFVRTLQDLHFDLLAGRTGRLVNGVGAFCLLTMCVTGLFIWWPGTKNWRKGFTVNLRRGWRGANWDLHNAVGGWTVGLVGIWAITGIYFVFPAQFRAAIDRVSPITVNRPPVSDPSGARPPAPPTWRSLVERARRDVPGQHVARVVVPSSDRAAVLVMFSETQPTPVGTPHLTSVYLDQYTGDILQEAPRSGRTAGDLVMAWAAPLHVGNFGGVAVKLAWSVFGLAPPLLFATGVVMWWTRGKASS